MNLSFKNRIAFYYMIATAVIMALIFGVIYFVVQETVMAHLDQDLSFEANKHLDEIIVAEDTIYFKNRSEWAEKEHLEIQVNPVFLQLVDKRRRVMDKSPNLKDYSLPFYESKYGGHFSVKLNNRDIRLAQVPIEQQGKIQGYILAAMSSESSISVLRNLRKVLLLSYLTVLLGLYFISRFLAGRSIKPVQNVTQTITRISNRNLKDRVRLPQNKDEIYDLAVRFNDLLERIESAIEREKQFTSDASHELRTPLATLRGTLEVLIRKERTVPEYEEKVRLCLKEIDRMTIILEQLLTLARLDTKDEGGDLSPVPLPSVIDKCLNKLQDKIRDKDLKVHFDFPKGEDLLTPNYCSTSIMDNLLSNAVKYSHPGGAIRIKVSKQGDKVLCVVEDEGIGISKEDLEHVFENFFRSDALGHKHIPGNGLGLSIVRKCAEAINAKLEMTSQLGVGTRVSILF